jgi:pimeloyl-ACP methyl ester carboxylesterase
MPPWNRESLQSTSSYLRFMMPELRHRQVDVEGASLHVVEAGRAGSPAILCLHGWPESATAFEGIMRRLADRAHVLAVDLPGIGRSTPAPASGDKRTLARSVRGLIAALGLDRVRLVGHDVGGQIVFALLHGYPGLVHRAVIMNVAVPGVAPWAEVRRNPAIWHFGFHAVPALPETLVAGRQAAYFDWFYDRLSASPGGVSASARQAYAEAYARPESLRAGFEWYRAFPQDERNNMAVERQAVDTPVLYLRGSKNPGFGLERYVEGLRHGGLRHVEGAEIADCGHFAPDEQPDAVADVLARFLELDASKPTGHAE